MNFADPLANGPNAVRSIPSSRWRLNLIWWIWLIALSALMFISFSQTNAVIVFTAAVIMCGIARPHDAFNAILNSKCLWPFLVYAALSLIWSQAPDLTARGVTQLIFTVGAAALVAQALSPKSFVSVVFGSCLTATVASILYLGPELIVQWRSGYPVQGIFGGSKNQFGAVEALLILGGFYFVLDRTRSPMTRMLTIACVCLAAILLISSRSATAVWALAPALICSGAAYFLVKFSPRWRATILLSVFAVSVVLTAMIIPVMENAFSLFLDASGRDATLTGRTMLWSWADRLIADKPILGFGYRAFWVVGNPYAEEIWREMGFGRPLGIHFHNQWYEITVQLGYVGLALALLTFLIVLIEVARWAVRAPSPESCFFLGFLVDTAIRTYVEVDLFAQLELAA